jgi:DNA repair protein RadC
MGHTAEQMVDIAYRKATTRGGERRIVNQLFRPSVIGSETAISAIRPLFRDSYREIVVVLGLDTRNNMTVAHIVSIGDPAQAMVPIASILKPLLLSNSVSFILIHNHPAGTLTPSQHDREVTQRVKQAGELLDLKCFDHIILGPDATEHYSFKEHNDTL